MKRRIVISDRDKQNARLLKAVLSPENYELYYAADPALCMAYVTANPPDILIADPLYPDAGGKRLIKSAIAAGCGAVIAVSSVGSERAITEILDSGADDYIRKPFLSGELSARVRACVRRLEALEKARGENVSDVYFRSGLRVDFDNRLVTVDSREIHLTKNEFRILSLLCRYSGRVLTYDFIIKNVWGAQAVDGCGILRVNIANLRKKIEQDSGNPLYLFTENGVGYKIAESTPENADFAAKSG